MGDEDVRDRPGLDHISDSEMSGFLDRDLAPADRQRVEAHLESCPECRRELVEVRRLAESYRPGALGTGRVWTRVVTGTAIAAGLVGLLLLPSSRQRPALRPDTVRAPAQVPNREGRMRIDVVAPVTDAPLAATAVAFTWHAAAADVYRLTLLTESGEPVWTLETADTSAALPARIVLAPGAYFWRVDAIADGITASTGVRRLVIAR